MRIRAGGYRIIYEVYDEEILGVVPCVAHRREVYR